MNDHAPPPMLCARCRRPLDAGSRYEGGRLVGINYMHSAIALPEDHLPEPIPDDGPASAVTVCDFCAAPGATWDSHPAVTPTPPRTVPKGPGAHASAATMPSRLATGTRSPTGRCATTAPRCGPAWNLRCVPCGARSSATEPTRRGHARPTPGGEAHNR